MIPLLKRGAGPLLSSLARDASLLSAILLRATIADFYAYFFVISGLFSVAAGEACRTLDEALLRTILLTVFVELLFASDVIARRETIGPRRSLGITNCAQTFPSPPEVLLESAFVFINYFHFSLRFVTKASFSLSTDKR